VQGRIRNWALRPIVATHAHQMIKMSYSAFSVNRCEASRPITIGQLRMSKRTDAKRPLQKQSDYKGRRRKKNKFLAEEKKQAYFLCFNNPLFCPFVFLHSALLCNFLILASFSRTSCSNFAILSSIISTVSFSCMIVCSFSRRSSEST